MVNGLGTTKDSTSGPTLGSREEGLLLKLVEDPGQTLMSWLTSEAGHDADPIERHLHLDFLNHEDHWAQGLYHQATKRFKVYYFDPLQMG